MNKRVLKLIISKNTSILQALKRMDDLSVRLLIVIDDDYFIGLISIGDLQRAIIKNLPLNTYVDKIFRKNVKVAYETDDFEFIKKEMIQNKAECMPIISFQNKLVDVIFWDNLFKEKKINEEKLDLPVIIMAGGRGSRMLPLTNIIPKPLIPVDKKTIVEHIIDNFQEIGCNSFYISINYKAEFIKDYFKKLDKNYNIEFFEEEKPLGTAGSLHLLNNRVNKTFFISNCDIIINEDYREVYKYHKKYNNELTIVGSLRYYPIPYGTLETGEDGKLISLQEKPQLSFLINSGMYILEPHLIKEIPENNFFHITDLIEKIKERNGRVGVFPVSEKSWIDIGEWDKYLKYIWSDSLRESSR
jgi:dTDP-glucose pyrophosphorylase